MQPEARPLTGPTASHRGDIALKTLFVVLCCAALYFRLEIFLWLPAWPLVGAAALTWGGWEERAGLLAFLTTLGATRQIFGLKAPTAGVILVDAAFLVALAVIALRNRRWWPSWAAAFQFAAVATRLLFFAPRPAMELYEYLVSTTIWTWLVFIAVSIGAYDRWRARDRDLQRGGLAAASFALMSVFAFWYVRPVLPSRLVELGMQHVSAGPAPADHRRERKRSD